MAVVVLAFVAIVGPLAKLARVIFVNRRVGREAEVGAALRSLNWSVHEHSGGGVPFPPLGASCWIIKGRFPRRLARVVGPERMEDTVTRSQITWTRGKGVIGRCWETGRELTINTGAIDARHQGCTPAAWEKTKEETRMGLTHREYSRISGKYGTVIAVPLLNGEERLIGVVTLDCPVGYHQELVDSRAADAVGLASKVIAGLV